NGSEVDDYHVQVSRYPDFRWCVCPTFDRYVSRTAYAGKTRWQPQFTGLLNPGERYYWRVRARNAQGVWSDWSRACAWSVIRGS
ncbi:MAG: fibronectin type III domain-containing protein, partial [Gemmatimonadota bacterium]|nr:fibronectin type III domain-containing protein [Gemmatimonadota bacterium]